ncbi:MAG: hypothetical protein HDKAJFGB_01503 [Anaerolineae bacterium]|nr:hypothetical protein [Anaerolineae bacterium]
MSEPGTRFVIFLGKRNIAAMTMPPSKIVCQFGPGDGELNNHAMVLKIFASAFSAGGVLTPNKLSNWPTKIIMAMPLVKPVTTGRGIKATTRPKRKMPTSIIKMPARMPATHMPSRPYLFAKTISTALMAPVGPEIWYGAPDKPPMRNPAMMAVTKPAAASAPEAMPNASANGSATAPTVMPASKSFCNAETL